MTDAPARGGELPFRPVDPLARPSAATLERALRAEGHDCRVEGRGAMAILVPDAEIDETYVGRFERRALLRAARAAGFTHVALELRDASARPDAVVPGGSTAG